MNNETKKDVRLSTGVTAEVKICGDAITEITLTNAGGQWVGGLWQPYRPEDKITIVEDKK